ncbi:hypothetical protein [Paraclostridium sp. AKS81]|uniref:hypothetical protein n=1 Tax=Paraclostridium sp. AKS81 TaxID=2876117 RepID=UPI0021E03DDA|nr:hypothetical protein [Paraclostridium sp. AKS81]
MTRIDKNIIKANCILLNAMPKLDNEYSISPKETKKVVPNHIKAIFQILISFITSPLKLLLFDNYLITKTEYI